MRPSPPALVSKSSKQWLARQFRDMYVRQRMSSPDQYRSRSAFKLLEMDSKYKFLADRRPKPVDRPRVIVDLGAAPGGWSQVVALKSGYSARAEPVDTMSYGLTPAAHIERQGSWSDVVAKDPKLQLQSNDDHDDGTKVIALDLNRIQPIRGVATIQADFLSPLAAALIHAHLPQDTEGPSVDVLLSDMAANASGNPVVDAENSLRICHAVWRFAEQHLLPRRGRIPGGDLVLKHFVHPDAHHFRATLLKPSFRRVYYVKPSASRAESSEGYWVCLDMLGPNVKRPPQLSIDPPIQIG